MTISIWRYSHLVLALSSGLFLILAAITGIILAFEPIQSSTKSYRPIDISEISLAETIGVLQNNYEEILSIEVDPNEFVLADVLTKEGESKRLFINPKTGQGLGEPSPQHPVFQFTTNLHRSLFLKSVGRFFVGLVSFLLCLIAITGLLLIIKRQGGLLNFFAKVQKDYFELRYHVIFGRWFLIPIIILAATGVYLSAEKFSLLPTTLVNHNIIEPNVDVDETVRPSDLDIFQNISLNQVRSVNFPFSPFPEDYFEVSLREKELYVHQYTGKILSEQPYPFSFLASKLSLTLHTGQGSILWSLVLLLASVSILFFIYSGFVMWRNRVKNGVKFIQKNKDECTHIILVGSETGTTLAFAKSLEKGLNQTGKKVFVSQLNDYSTYQEAEHMFILTATYGEGDAPTNARKFKGLLHEISQPNTIKYSVVGFGSTLYPDYCQFAIELDEVLSIKSGFEQMVPLHKINNQSFETFKNWADHWSKATGDNLDLAPIKLNERPLENQKFEVVRKTDLNTDDTFLIHLTAKTKVKFRSGDLLEYRPKEDGIPRWFSIAKIGKEILLSVKKHEFGVVSNYLNELKQNEVVKAAIKPNSHFHFPREAKEVICISNGTGIAPFLGIIDENDNKIPFHLYWGGRTANSLEIYKPYLDQFINKEKLASFHIAFSRDPSSKEYVQDIVAKNFSNISRAVNNGAVIMICGSLNMQNAVLNILEGISAENPDMTISNIESKGQLKMDCY